MAKNIKPRIQVEKRGGQFLPITRYDAEEIEKHPDGQLYNVIVASDRSDPHHKFYWLMLNKVVQNNNELWATSAHLHDDLKMILGYYRTVINQATGGVYNVPNSTAYKSMDQKEFREYFDKVVERLTKILKYDPTIFE